MKKRLFALLLVLLLSALLLLPAAALDTPDYVVDEAGILDGDELYDLQARAAGLAETYGVSVYVIILEDYSYYGDSMEDAADSIRWDNDLGEDTGGDLILLVLSMAERDYWLLDDGEYMIYAVTDEGHESLKDAFLGHFGSDDWYSGLSSFLGQCEYILDAAASGTPVGYAYSSPEEERFYSAVTSYGIAFVIGLLAALITCSIFKRQMKTAVKATAADAYVGPQGVNITLRDDLYTHTTTTRRRIEKSSSSSGSGGNHSSGGKF